MLLFYTNAVIIIIQRICIYGLYGAIQMLLLVLFVLVVGNG